MAKKRSIKVCSQSGYKYKETPVIILKGQWLKDAGFNIGDYISVTCEEGRLIIAQDAEKAAMKAAEDKFMEEGIKDLRRRYEAEKEAIRAQCVAETGAGGMSMFTAEELQAIDRKYFSVIVADAYDVTLISKNTGHVWYIHNVELTDCSLCIVYHKHHISHPYHSHSRCGTLRKAIRDIKSHDKFQLNGRKPIYKH